ncbi:MAG: hypothetical protein ACMUIP_12235 [bacterium]
MSEKIMATMSEIKKTIVHLPEDEFNSFADWFQKLEEERWDKELEKDIAEGKFDDFAKEALDEFKSRPRNFISIKPHFFGQNTLG